MLDAGACSDIEDKEGKTALHYALETPSSDQENKKGSHNQVEIVMLLLKKGASLGVDIGKQQTPLHLAARSGDPKRTSKMLHCNVEALFTKDRWGMTPLDVACHPDARPGTTESVFDVLAEYIKRESKEDEALTIEAKSQLGHRFVQRMLSKDRLDDSNLSWSAIEWATHRQKRLVLWSLITSSPPTSRTKKALVNSHSIVDKFIKDLESKRKECGKVKSSKAISSQDQERRGKTDRRPATDKGQPYHERMGNFKAIKDTLNYFIIAQTYRRIEKFELPSHSEPASKLLDEHDSIVIEFFMNKNRASRVGKIISVKETIYKKGPRQIIKDARQEVNDIRRKIENSRREDEGIRQHLDDLGQMVQDMRQVDDDVKATSSAAEDPNSQKASDKSTQFTWIHLPSTNVSAKFLCCNDKS